MVSSAFSAFSAGIVRVVPVATTTSVSLTPKCDITSVCVHQNLASPSTPPIPPLAPPPLPPIYACQQSLDWTEHSSAPLLTTVTGLDGTFWFTVDGDKTNNGGMALRGIGVAQYYIFQGSDTVPVDLQDNGPATADAGPACNPHLVQCTGVANTGYCYGTVQFYIPEDCINRLLVFKPPLSFTSFQITENFIVVAACANPPPPPASPPPVPRLPPSNPSPSNPSPPISPGGTMTSHGMTVAFEDDVGVALSPGSSYNLTVYAHSGTSSVFNPTTGLLETGYTNYSTMQTESTKQCSAARNANGVPGTDIKWMLHCRLYVNRRNAEGADLAWGGMVDTTNKPTGCSVELLSFFGPAFKDTVRFNKNTDDNDSNFHYRICEHDETTQYIAGAGLKVHYDTDVFSHAYDCNFICGSIAGYTPGLVTISIQTFGCSETRQGEFVKMGYCTLAVREDLQPATLYERASYWVVDSMVNQGTQAVVQNQLMIAINTDGTPRWALDIRTT